MPVVKTSSGSQVLRVGRRRRQKSANRLRVRRERALTGFPFTRPKRHLVPCLQDLTVDDGTPDWPSDLMCNAAWPLCEAMALLNCHLRDRNSKPRLEAVDDNGNPRMTHGEAETTGFLQLCHNLGNTQLSLGDRSPEMVMTTNLVARISDQRQHYSSTVTIPICALTFIPTSGRTGSLMRWPGIWRPIWGLRRLPPIRSPASRRTWRRPAWTSPWCWAWRRGRTRCGPPTTG